MWQELAGLLERMGAALVGSADLRALPPEARADMPFGVSIAVALDPQVVAGIAGGPTPEYLALYHSENRRLGEMSEAAAAWLAGRGFRALPRPATGDWDATSLRAPVQHKTVATRAGLGWIGRCALLVTDRYGSAVRLASVLTDAPLPAGEPVERSRCGDCRACVDVCPGGAPSGADWVAGVPREEFFDAFACRDAARERARRTGDDILICGMCIAACPHTRRYLARALRSPGDQRTP